MRRRLRALLPRLHLLPALSGQLDQWAEWLVRTRFAGRSVEEIEEGLAELAEFRDTVLDNARIRPGDTVVDAGTGTGLMFYLIGSADILPLPNESVDVVLTRSVLIYVRDKGESAREFFRVLRAGGRVSIVEPINKRNTRLSEGLDLRAGESEISAERMLTAIGAPGRKSMLHVWQERFTAKQVAELVQILRAQQTIRRAWPQLHLSAEKP